MFFIFKKSTIILDCFISDDRIANLFPIEKTINAIPTWWKSLPKEINLDNYPVPMSTIKRCPGFKDLFANSITIPAWGEYRLFLDPSGQFSYLSPNHKIEAVSHSNSQFQNAFDNYSHLKLTSPWFIKEKSGVKFSMLQAVWHQTNPSEFIIPPGMLEFKYQHATHINLISSVGMQRKEITISAGNPITYLVPLTEKSVEIRVQVIDDKECNKLKTYHHSFHNSYETSKKILQETK